MMNFTNNNQTIIIGIDHGYGNCKTRNFCFRSGVAAYDKEPTFKENLLVYNNRYYLVGEEHKEFLSDKMADNDYYILTLAAIAKELNNRHLTSAKVHIAAGLPLTWVSEQKETFKAYLMQNESADFVFKNISYHIEIVGVSDLYEQLDKEMMFQVHKSFIVNFNYIFTIKEGNIQLYHCDKLIPISRSYKKAFLEEYTNFTERNLYL